MNASYKDRSAGLVEQTYRVLRNTGLSPGDVDCVGVFEMGSDETQNPCKAELSVEI